MYVFPDPMKSLGTEGSICCAIAVGRPPRFALFLVLFNSNPNGRAVELASLMVGRNAPILDSTIYSTTIYMLDILSPLSSSDFTLFFSLIAVALAQMVACLFPSLYGVIRQLFTQFR
jgi:hypothetical protein